MKQPCLKAKYICGPSVPILEPLISSILHLYEQLKKLGFTYYKGKIVIIDTREVNHE